MNLGDTIRILRSGKGLSQNDLAAMLGVSRQSVSKWEADGAVPDLDKLIGMSEIFGVTLDSMVKGTPSQTPTADAAQTTSASRSPAKAAHPIAGVILLCFGALVMLLLLFLDDVWSGLLFASPFLLCGMICLFTRSHTGLFCFWAVFFCVDFYLRYATGITWQIVFLTPVFTPEMNYMRLAIGWGQFLWGILLLALTLRSFRTRTEPLDKKHLLSGIGGLVILAGITLAQRGVLAYWHSLPYERMKEAWYLLLRFFGDSIRFVLLTALLVKACALLRQWRTERRLGKKSL